MSEGEELSDAEKVYAECGQQRPLPWEECILPHRSKGCVKIGEGTFGEVFSTTNAAGETVALKVWKSFLLGVWELHIKLTYCSLMLKVQKTFKII